MTLIQSYGRNDKQNVTFNNGDAANCLTARMSKDGSDNLLYWGDPNTIDEKSNVRRLTEIECERLQGFPDDWTKYGIFDGVVKPISKTQRYKLLGNAVTTDWPELIGNRLLTNN